VTERSDEQHTHAWRTRFHLAASVAREAGCLALRHFRDLERLDVERKGDRSVVSAADRAVETLVRTRLSESFPQDGLLGEEHGGTPAPGGCTWIIDPIDGTDCFVNGIPVWCVSIAAVADGEIELGVIYDPNAEELFTARRGEGAWLNGEPMRPSTATELSEGLVGTGFSHRVTPGRSIDIMRRLLDAGGMYQRNGSGALMIAYVAAGRFLAYHEHHINAWDALAALAMVRETGGWTNDFLAGDGLVCGNEVAACAPGVEAEFRALIGL
jgi:myo-inositol-1(or 4)-monophosphatase